MDFMYTKNGDLWDPAKELNKSKVNLFDVRARATELFGDYCLEIHDMKNFIASFIDVAHMTLTDYVYRYGKALDTIRDQYYKEHPQAVKPLIVPLGVIPSEQLKDAGIDTKTSVFLAQKGVHLMQRSLSFNGTPVFKGACTDFYVPKVVALNLLKGNWEKPYSIASLTKEELSSDVSFAELYKLGLKIKAMGREVLK